MRRVLTLTLVLASLLIPAAVEDAPAHTSYGGHGCKTWTVTSPTSGATSFYWECFVQGWGNGPHYHRYKTSYKPCAYDRVCTVRTLHYHDRAVTNTHPV